jgi:hypothetical protein
LRHQVFCRGAVGSDRRTFLREAFAMSDTLSETTACDLLARLFRARGYAVSRNLMFREYGVSFHIDGWDSTNRIGFEFLTSEDDDHDDLSLEEYKTLMAAQQRGELSLFIMDEVEPLSAAELTASVHEFLDEVAEARQARRQPVLKKRSVKKKTPTKKRVAATRKPGKVVPKKTVSKTRRAGGRKTAKKKR